MKLPEQNDSFLLAQAFVKLRGDGLAYDMSRVEFRQTLSSMLGGCGTPLVTPRPEVGSSSTRNRQHCVRERRSSQRRCSGPRCQKQSCRHVMRT